MSEHAARPARWWSSEAGKAEARRLGLGESARVALAMGVIYQVYPRSFHDTTGNGVGDLPGITSRLDHLSDTLGVDTVWISPFYPSPMADFGYDIADYCDVDPRFGTLADFDELVASCHRRGLRIIIDWVPNHTSDQHPWFRASRSSRNDPKRDWYVWADPKDDGAPPNNWLSVFGDVAWEWDDHTGQYYLHSFLPAQPDLNWRNPEVQAAMFDTLRFWLDRGVDGFRIDVAHYLMKDPQLRDEPGADPDEPRLFKSLGDYDSLRHIYDKGHPDIHRVFRGLRELLDSYDGDRFAVGEIHVFDWERWAAYYGADDELHMPFNFSLVWTPWNAAAVRDRIDAQERVVPPWAWPNQVLGNHDEPRLVSRVGSAAARVAAMLLLTMRGTPTIYYGDELGLPQVEVPPEREQDPWGIRVPGQGRDGCRTPMQWTAEPGAGFTTADEPWLPFTPGAERLNVAAEMSDPGSMLNLYRRLLALRRAEPALSYGGYEVIRDTPDGVLAYLRRAEGDGFAVALNFTSRPVTFSLGRNGAVAVGTNPERDGAPVGSSFELRPDEGVVIRIDGSSARGAAL